MSGSASRRRGRTFQTAVRQWWQDQGFTVIEPGGAGMEATDLVLMTESISIEVKNQKAMDLAGWLDQAVRQAIPGTTAIVHHKRKGKADIGDCYVTLRAADLAYLLGER